MACPRCGSNDLWDDNLAWGCNPCGYAVMGDGKPTFIFAKDKPGLARSVQEMEQSTRRDIRYGYEREAPRATYDDEGYDG